MWKKNYLPFYKAGASMKRSMKKAFCFTVFAVVVKSVILAPLAFGQSFSGACYSAAPDVITGSHILCSPYRDLNPFYGLPGEINQWGPGNVYLQNGDSVTGRFLVYNGLGSNLLTVKYGTETVFAVDKSTVKRFVFRSEKNSDEIYNYEYFPMKGWYFSDGDGIFLQILVKDTVSLYYLATIEKFPMSDNLKGHRYYFIQKYGSELKRVLPNRRSLCKALDSSGEFQKHLHSLHLRTRKREGMIKSVQEYNRFIIVK
jgi:hypothetical protein